MHCETFGISNSDSDSVENVNKNCPWGQKVLPSESVP